MLDTNPRANRDQPAKRYGHVNNAANCYLCSCFTYIASGTCRRLLELGEFNLARL